MPQSSVFSSLVIVWLFLWTFLVGSVDEHCAMLVIHALRARSFPSVPGTITRSEIHQAQRSDESPAAPQLAIRYEFTVDGKLIAGNRLAFWELNWPGGLRQLEQRQEQLPVGQPVEVFYDPNDITNSALDRRLGGGPLFLALVLTPFNAVMLAGWIWWRRRRRGIVGRLVHRDGQRWVVRRSLGNPWLTGLLVAGIISVGEIIVVCLGQFQESVPVLSGVWGLLLALTGLATWHARKTRFFEPAVLVCDESSGTVAWPSSCGNANWSISATEWRRVEFDEAPAADSPEASANFRVSLCFVDEAGRGGSRTVLTSEYALDALQLTEWLTDWFHTQQANRPGQPAEPPPAARG